MKLLRFALAVALALTLLTTSVAAGAPSSSATSADRCCATKTASVEHVAYAKASTVVYITKTGKKYHRSGCRYLKKSKIRTTLKKAKARRYKPCSVCKPPR